MTEVSRPLKINMRRYDCVSKVGVPVEYQDRVTQSKKVVDEDFGVYFQYKSRITE